MFDNCDDQNDKKWFIKFKKYEVMLCLGQEPTTIMCSRWKSRKWVFIKPSVNTPSHIKSNMTKHQEIKHILNDSLKSIVCKLVKLPISFGIVVISFSSLVQSNHDRNERAWKKQSAYHHIYNQRWQSILKITNMLNKNSHNSSVVKLLKLPISVGSSVMSLKASVKYYEIEISMHANISQHSITFTIKND